MQAKGPGSQLYLNMIHCEGHSIQINIWLHTLHIYEREGKREKSKCVKILTV